MRKFLSVNTVKLTKRAFCFAICMSALLTCERLYAGVGFSDVFIIKNDTDQIVEMDVKQGEAQLKVWMDKYETRRVGCRLFGTEGIGPVEFLGDFQNWKDGKTAATLKVSTDIDTENAETDEGNVYCVKITQEGKNGEDAVISDARNCNTTLYGEGPRKLKFTIHVDNQFDDPVWVGIMEEKIGFKMCVPPHAELNPFGDRPSEAAVETSRTMNLRNLVIETDKLASGAKLDIASIYSAKENENAFSDDPIVLGMDTLEFYLPLKSTKQQAGILSEQPYLKVTVIKSDIRDETASSGTTPILGYEYNLIFEAATKQDKVDYEGRLLSEK